jgi:hypothetical protein
VSDARTRVAACAVCEYQMLGPVSSGTLVRMLSDLADHLRDAHLKHHDADLVCFCVHGQS